MKIAVGIPSRGRPLDLAASIKSLDKTKTQGNGHEVSYIIGLDDDDIETRKVAQKLLLDGYPIRVTSEPRAPSLGAIHNRMIKATDADAIFLLWSDRVVPINEHWDHAISYAALQYPKRVLWLDSIHLVGAGQFILPPLWRGALPGDPCPALFPFWFEDSWVEEVDAFVHGFPRVATYARCAGPRTAKTNRMRDLHFWIDFYTFLRMQRIEEAKHTAAALGMLPRSDIEVIKEFFDKRDVQFHERAEELTDTYAAGGDPDDSYLSAKAHAEAIMRKRAA